MITGETSHARKRKAPDNLGPICPHPENKNKTKIQYDDSESEDFEAPKSRNTAPSKIVKSKILSKPKKKNGKTKSATAKKNNKIMQNFFGNVVSEYGTRENLDPDQLQMALALSRSIVQTQGPGDDTEDRMSIDPADMEIDEKKNAVHSIFKKFGFQPLNGKSNGNVYNVVKKYNNNVNNFV